MYILGINSGVDNNTHDSAAALLKDGQLICMVEQERISHRKRSVGEAPGDAIAACLSFANITLADVEAVALGWNINKVFSPLNEESIYKRLLSLEDTALNEIPTFHLISHSLSHAASAFWTSGFDKATILVIDGTGEAESTTTALGTHKDIQLLAEWDITQSLGNFYTTAAEWVGFSIENVSQLTKLASYGQIAQNVPLRPTSTGYTFINSPIPHRRVYKHFSQQRAFLHRYFSSSNYPSYSNNRHSDPMIYTDFAASVQYALEEAILQLARVTCEQTKEDRLVLAGEVAMNSKVNRRLANSGLFKDLYVPPVPYDAGVSLGAALMVHHQLHQDSSVQPRMKHAYWAPGFSEKDFKRLLQSSGLTATWYHEFELVKKVAAYLNTGSLVAWVQGRAEVGQHALGARSILGDPRQSAHSTRINELMESQTWLPVSTNVMEEYAESILEQYPSSLTDFMMESCSIRTEMQQMIPAVTQVDGTTTPQIVCYRNNSRYWLLINAFRELTGIPVLINSPLSLAGEPIAYTPADALKIFCASQLDILVLDNYLIEKSK